MILKIYWQNDNQREEFIGHFCHLTNYFLLGAPTMVPH